MITLESVLNNDFQTEFDSNDNLSVDLAEKYHATVESYEFLHTVTLAQQISPESNYIQMEGFIQGVKNIFKKIKEWIKSFIKWVKSFFVKDKPEVERDILKFAKEEMEKDKANGITLDMIKNANISPNDITSNSIKIDGKPVKAYTIPFNLAVLSFNSNDPIVDMTYTKDGYRANSSEKVDINVIVEEMLSDKFKNKHYVNDAISIITSNNVDKIVETFSNDEYMNNVYNEADDTIKILNNLDFAKIIDEAFKDPSYIIGGEALYGLVESTKKSLDELQKNDITKQLDDGLKKLEELSDSKHIEGLIDGHSNALDDKTKANAIKLLKKYTEINTALQKYMMNLPKLCVTLLNKLFAAIKRAK